MSDSPSAGLTATLRTYPRVFWVANVMELFERAAYYGMNSVLAVYLSNPLARGGLGFTESSVGFLQSLIYAFTYVVPILGGALADRYGYRRMLIVAFSFMTVGYWLTGAQSAYGLVFGALCVMAFGAGLFKPIISGTIARSTTEENSGLGFGIYYWMINVGAFLAPLLVTWLKGMAWRYVFTASAIYVALMLPLALFVFRDPPKPKSAKGIAGVLRGAALVLGDARFMLMIVVYSCFWILYFQNFGSVLWYLRDFVDAAPVDRLLASLGVAVHFDAEHVTVINALTIIVLQVAISRLVKDVAPLPTMISGLVVGALGFLCLAASRNVWVFILGIAVFSVGEMTAHPKYYSYIGLVAPADKKAVYMGYAFLYGVIGSLIGSSVGGALYDARLKPLIGTPGIQGDLRAFWLLFVALDVAAVAGLLLYNRYFAADTPSTNERARRIMLGVYALIVAVGAYFLYASVAGRPEPSYKTMVQAAIMLLIGGGGVAFSARRPAPRPA